MRNKAATDTTDKAKLEAFSNILAAITCEFYNFHLPARPSSSTNAVIGCIVHFAHLIHCIGRADEAQGSRDTQKAARGPLGGFQSIVAVQDRQDRHTEPRKENLGKIEREYAFRKGQGLHHSE